MPAIWSNNNGSYEPFRLAPSTQVPTEHRFAVSDGESWIVPLWNSQRHEYALIAKLGATVRVNGLALVGGLRVLQHKDEIVIRSQQMYFSSEATPVVESFGRTGDLRLPQCPICRGEIKQGSEVVRCPGCLRLYHQIAATDQASEKFCWTYVPRCRFCEHPTSLSGDLLWRPDNENLG